MTKEKFPAGVARVAAIQLENLRDHGKGFDFERDETPPADNPYHGNLLMDVVTENELLARRVANALAHFAELV